MLNWHSLPDRERMTTAIRTHFGEIAVAQSLLDVASKSDVSLLFRF